MYEEKAVRMDEDSGPLQSEVGELRKRVESLHLTVDRLERKLRPVLRSVPDEPVPDGTQPRLMQAPLTEIISDLNRSIGQLEMRLNDVNTRCEL